MYFWIKLQLPLRNRAAKISLFILTVLVFAACNTVKRVPKGKKLLTKNTILINGVAENSDLVSNLIYQKPNSKLAGYHLRLNLYNLAKLNHDSIYQAKYIKNPKKYERQSKWLSAKQVNRMGQSFWYAGIHNFLRDNGEPPTIIDEKSAQKSANRLQSYYFNLGFFDVKTSFTIDSIAPKKAKINYLVTTGKAFEIDSLKINIESPVLDSLYTLKKELAIVKTKQPYKTESLENERSRITTYFRNNGAFQFQQNYISYDIDTINTNKKANLSLKIGDYSYRENDSTKTKPFQLYTISEVNIYTDYAANKTKVTLNDSVKTSYSTFNLFSKNKLRYRPKALTDAVFITKGSLFSDTKTTLTTRYLNNLKIFNYPSIQYEIDKRDPLQNALIANIYLAPREKFSLAPSLSLTHSNIQDFGISGSASLAIRNVFNGAETFEIAARGNIGSSKDLANSNDRFFNVSEYGLDMKLNFPRLLLFFGAEKIIPKSMIPSTVMSIGFSKQENIGLDKENVSGSLSYNWNPIKNANVKYDLFNIQYIKNINTANYFNVYNSSYTTLNNLAIRYNADPTYFSNGNLIITQGTDNFINAVLGTNPTILPTDPDKKIISSINERRKRLTENNFILSSSYTYTKTSKSDASDETFHGVKSKIELAGNVLSLLTRSSDKFVNESGNRNIFGVEFSQYIKTEVEYVKHWDLSHKNILAFRSFVGIAIPYGNSDNIPFSRSYYSGGSNDNRAWQSYSLGPGRTSAVNDFNEANFKISGNLEHRFNLFGQVNGALFVDAGNIWNVFDNVTDEKAVFSGIKSLQDIAVGSGFGLRYDFSFFVVRLDFGFKTYNPAELTAKKWFRDYNFSNGVVNIGINYPF